MKMLLLLWLLTFAFPAISLSSKDEAFPVIVDADGFDDTELELKPLCVVDIEMRDGCDGEQKCRCPENSECRVTSVEDKLSVCRPSEAEPKCYYKTENSKYKQRDFLCNRYCFCPEGYTCHEAEGPGIFPVKCLLTEVTTPAPRVCPIGGQCDVNCVCRPGEYCLHGLDRNWCRSIETTTEPEFTELPMLECGVNDFLCDIGCVCPAGKYCHVDLDSRHCQDSIVVDPTSSPICEDYDVDKNEDEHSSAPDETMCDVTCKCKEGKECKIFYGYRLCMPPEPETTVSSPLPVCETWKDEHCDLDCVCPDGEECHHIISEKYGVLTRCDPKEQTSLQPATTSLPECSLFFDPMEFCDMNCVCPPDWECTLRESTYGLFRCAPTRHEPTPLPICEDGINFGGLDKIRRGDEISSVPQSQCDVTCKCGEGNECKHIFGVLRFCMSTEPETTLSPLPVCETGKDGCDVDCVCPEGEECYHTGGDGDVVVRLCHPKVQPQCISEPTVYDRLACFIRCSCPDHFKCYTLRHEPFVRCTWHDKIERTTPQPIYTLEPLPSTTALPTCEIVPYGLLESCDIYCVCPEGYECVLGPTMTKICRLFEEETTLYPVPTSLPICPPNDFTDCVRDCVCSEGSTCITTIIGHSCIPEAQPTLDPMLLPVCEVDPDLAEQTGYCGSSCDCPDGYYCPMFGIFCEKNESPLAPLAICETDFAGGPGPDCVLDCVCPDAYKCVPNIFSQTNYCKSESLFPICEFGSSGGPGGGECDLDCLCPDDYKCVASGLIGSQAKTCDYDRQQESLIEKVDELAGEAVDLAKQQLEKVQKIQKVIGSIENNVEEMVFKQFA